MNKFKADSIKLAISLVDNYVEEMRDLSDYKEYLEIVKYVENTKRLADFVYDELLTDDQNYFKYPSIYKYRDDFCESKVYDDFLKGQHVREKYTDEVIFNCYDPDNILFYLKRFVGYADQMVNELLSFFKQLEDLEDIQNVIINTYNEKHKTKNIIQQNMIVIRGEKILINENTEDKDYQMNLLNELNSNYNIHNVELISKNVKCCKSYEIPKEKELKIVSNTISREKEHRIKYLDDLIHKVLSAKYSIPEDKMIPELKQYIEKVIQYTKHIYLL